MSIVLKGDFTGQYSVSKSCYDELLKYITKYEKHYLLRLLGADLYALFIADLDASVPQVPQTARFIAIFDAFEIDDSNCIRISEGMRAMLIQFIYFHYIRDTNNKKDITGVVVNNPENSKSTPYNGYNLVESYNQGVTNYKEIQWFICDDSATYPEENTQELKFISGI